MLIEFLMQVCRKCLHVNLLSCLTWHFSAESFHSIDILLTGPDKWRLRYGNASLVWKRCCKCTSVILCRKWTTTPATQEESPRVGEKELQKVSKPDMKTISHVNICREEGLLWVPGLRALKDTDGKVQRWIQQDS